MNMYSNEIRKDVNVLRLENTLSENNEKGRIYVNDKILIPGVIKPEESILGSDKHKDFLTQSLENYFMFLQPEGPLLRVYYFCGEWYVSTPGKLSAHKSFWGSSFSFGQIFNNFLLDIFTDLKVEFWDTLDPAFAYYFYLRPTRHNRVVLRYDKDNGQHALIFAGMMPLNSTNVTQFIYAQTISASILPKVKRITGVYKHTICEPGFKPAVALTCFHLTTGKTFKFWNPEYFEKKNIRGNDPYPLRRFCFLKLTDDSSVEEFLEFFPTRIDHYSHRYNNFLALANNILRGLANREYDKIYEKVGSLAARNIVSVTEAALAILGEVSWPVLNTLI